MVIVQTLNRVLPPEYTAQPRVHLGRDFEVDVATWERGGPSPRPLPEGSRVTALWAPPKATWEWDADLGDSDEYEVRVWDGDNQLRAAIELISPRNKDRPSARSAFVSKWAVLLREGVCLVLVDVVTIRPFNLFGELLEVLEVRPPEAEAATEANTPLYAVSCRACSGQATSRMEVWPSSLRVGEPLPTLPLWLGEQRAVPLDLEASYEQTCRDLRIA
jgi:hypothetical protein